MSDISDAKALIHGSYNTVDNIWGDEIGSAQVIKEGSTTKITYTFLQQLPTYYSGEPEATVGGGQSAFVAIDGNSALGQALSIILGQSNDQTGFETSFSDVASIVFSGIDNSNSSDNVGAITFASIDQSVLNATYVPDKDDGSTLGYVTRLAWQDNVPFLTYDNKEVGDVWFDRLLVADPVANGRNDDQYSVALHEIGHALGLEHPTPSSNNAEALPNLTGEESTIKYTVMVNSDGTIFQHPDMYYAPGDSALKYTTSLGLYDIAAIQTIYGRDYTTRFDNTTYDINHGLSHNAFTYTIWDGQGADTIDASGYMTSVEIDLRQGHFSSIGLDGNPDGGRVIFDDESGQPDNVTYDAGNVAIAFYTVIENATGTNANDILIGNAWNNVLYGSDGDDIVYGDGLTYDSDRGFGTRSGEVDKNSPSSAYAQDLSGNDVLIGGKGNDTLFGGRGSDILEGGFNLAQLNAANPHWNDAHQFDGIQDLTVAEDADANGGDTADYSRLGDAAHDQNLAVTVHITDVANHTGTVDKTYTLTELNGRIEHKADQFFSIEKFIGTGGIDTIDLKDHADGTYHIDDATHITIDGQQFEFQGFEEISLNDQDNTLLPNGVYGWTIDGGAGINTLNYSDVTTGTGLTVDLFAGTVTDGINTDYIANFQNVIGSGGDDTIYAKELITSHIEGGAGNDTLDFSHEFQPTFDWIQNTNEILFDMASGTATDIGHGTVSFTGIEHIVLGTGTINQVDAALGSSMVFSDGESLRAYNINDIFNYSNLGGVHFEVQLNGDVLVHKADGTIDTILHSDEIQHVFVTTPGDGSTLTYAPDATVYDDLLYGFINDFQGVDTITYPAGYGGVAITNPALHINASGNDTFIVNTPERGGAGYVINQNAGTAIDINGHAPVNVSGAHYTASVNDDIITGTGIVLDGGPGNDTFIYNGGDMIISDSDGANVVQVQGFGNAGAAKDGFVIDQHYDSATNTTKLTFQMMDDDGNRTNIGSVTAQGSNVPEISVGTFTGDTIDLSGESNPLGSFLNAGEYNDIITGSAFNDTLRGWGGNDTINGGDGFDHLYGDSGGIDFFGNISDDLDRGGNDILNAGDGGALMDGGLGQDKYILSDAGAPSLIQDPGGIDTVVFQFGGGSSSFDFAREAGTIITFGDGSKIQTKTDDLIVRLGGNIVAVILGDTVEKFQFANGEVKTYADVTPVLTSSIADPISVQFLHPAHGTDSIVAQGSSTYTIMTGSDHDDVFHAGTGGATINALDGDDVIDAQGEIIAVGGRGNDRITGSNGDDVIYGDSNNDVMARGDDTLDGRDGDDSLFGGGGNDTYIASNGQDTIFDNAGLHDTIKYSDGVTLADLNMYRDTHDNLIIQDHSGNSITINVQFAIPGAFDLEIPTPSGSIETLTMGDGSQIELFPREYVTQGTDDDDTIYGITFAGSPNDTIYGNGGNDTISAGIGSNIVHGNAGDDTLIADAAGSVNQLFGDEGEDTLVIQAGISVADGGTGNDTFKYAGGIATIVDTDGASDKLIFENNSFYQLNFVRSGNDLDIRVTTENSGDHVLIQDQLGADPQIENIIMADGVTFDLASFANNWVVGDYTDNVIVGDQFVTNLNDTLLGYEGDDNLSGGQGNDMLWGGMGNDILNGGTGDNTLVGGMGDDTYIAGGGIDTIIDKDQYVDPSLPMNVSQGNDTIVMWDGITRDQIDMFRDTNDALHIVDLTSSRQIIVENQFNTDNAAYAVENLKFSDGSTLNLLTHDFRTEGTDEGDTILGIVSGGGQNDTINGYGADDTLNGGAGNDTLVGGVGDDLLYGGLGNDTYVIDSGIDRISDNGGNDTLHFNAPVSASDLQFGGFPYDVWVSYGSGIVIIENQMNPNLTAAIETITFSNDLTLDFTHYQQWMVGTLWATGAIDGTIGNDTILANGGSGTFSGFDGNDTIVGGNQDDMLNGGNGNDILYGGDGNDILSGGDGDDVFMYNAGMDVIQDSAGADVLKFDPGIHASDLHFIKSGNDAQIILHQGTDEITITGQLDGNADHQVESLHFADGLSLNFADFQNWVLGTGSSGPVQGTSGNDTIIANADDGVTLEGNGGNDIFIGGGGVDTINGGAGNDLLYGGNGNDILNGGTGNDVYFYFPGDGDDVINDAGGLDVVQLAKGMELSALTFSRVGNDLVISGYSSMTIHGQFSGDTSKVVETLKFFDGSMLDLTQLNLGVTNVPIAHQDDFVTLRDHTVTGNLLVDNGHGGDISPDGQPLTVIAGQLSTVSGGVALITASGDFTYTPASGFVGLDSFQYTVQDSSGHTASATVNLDIRPAANTAPIAQSDDLATTRDHALTANVLADNGHGADSDYDGDALSVVAQTVTTTGGGTAVFLASGGLTYSPSAGFTGVDHVNYTLSDGHGGTATGTVNINVAVPVNQSPVAQNDTLTIAEDNVLHGNVLADNGHGIDSDPDSDPLTVTAQSFTTVHGAQVVLQADGNFTYAPTANYNGADSFNYTISDGHGGTASALVGINITPVNDAPVAHDGSVTIAEDVVLHGNLLAQADDVDGDTLSAIAGSSVTAQGGTVSIQANGDYAYTPVTNFYGSDSFSYTVNDGHGGQATATINVNVTPVNDVPVAVNDQFVVDEDHVLNGNVLTNDSDVDHDSLSVSPQNVTTANGGQLILNADGTFSYTPVANYNGTDSFTYTVSDGHGGTASATAGITINPVNDAPVAKNDDFTGIKDMDVEGNLLANNGHGADFDLDGDVLKVIQDTIASAAGGSVILMANGDFVYMPPAGFTGTDTFNYTVTDNNGGTSMATATLEINPSVSVNHAPVAEADHFSSKYLDSVAGNVLSNNGHGADHDADGNPLSVQAAIITTIHGGIVTLNADGTFVYTPNSGFIGQDSFTYTLKDGQGGVSTGVVALDITTRADQIIGTSGNNILNGDNHNNTISGLAGNDKITGNNGNDLLIGGQGNDVIKGGAGNDILIGDDVTYSQHFYSDNDILFPKIRETVSLDHLHPSGTPALGIIHGDLSSATAQDITITFQQTGAGYNNSLGSYIIGADGTIQGVSLEFTNVKDYKAGDSATLHVSGAPDSDFGFFIIADGARANHNYSGLDLSGNNLKFYYDYGQADQRLAKVTDSADHISLVYENGSQHQVLQGNIYHTTERGASDLSINPDDTTHVISGYSDGTDHSSLRIGFEDLYNSGDADYNDVVFDIKINPVYQDAGTIGGNDTLNGGDGNDILIGGAGNDILTGGKGADLFVFSVNNGIDHITDFNAHQGDRLDLSNLIKDYDPVDDIISQFVQLTQQGKNEVLAVDSTGTGQHFQTVAVLDNTNHLSVDDLVHNGNLIV